LAELESRWYRPHEVAERLGVPDSTLRTYAAHFASLLSTAARPDSSSDGRGFRHRRYAEADLATLRTAKELLDAGMNYEAILSRLGGVAVDKPASRPRRRPVRSRQPVEIARSTAPEDRGVASDSADPVVSDSTAIAIDELGKMVDRAVADSRNAWQAARANQEADSEMLDLLARQLREIQSRLDRLEELVTTYTSPPRRQGWLARLLGHD